MPDLAQHTIEEAAPKINGVADLAFAVRQGRTRLVQSQTRPPLVVQRALYLDEALPDMAFLYLSNPTAGILQGDHLEIAIESGPSTRLHLTTPAATKIHPMPDSPALQEASICLREDAYLEYLPEPIIPFREARFSQRASITIDSTASLVYGEVILPGRVDHGESYEYKSFSQRLTIARPDGHPLVQEAFCLTPQSASPRVKGVLGLDGVKTLGALWVVTGQVKADALLELLRENLAALFVDKEDIELGTSLLPYGCGVGIKVLSSKVETVKKGMRAGWSGARRLILNADLPDTRKY